MIKRNVEHEKEMKLQFPDYPCFECSKLTKNCQYNTSYCYKWKTWFCKHWGKLRKDLQ